MDWARKRQLAIIGILVAFFVVLGTGVWLVFFRTAPSCIDNKQNQDEEGVDCGGSCSYLCTASLSNPEPVVKFVRTLSPLPGRIDVIAYVDNPNFNAEADAVPYTVEIYDNQNVLVARRTGTVDLPPGITTPLFIPNVAVGTDEQTHAFLTIDTKELRFTRQDARAKETTAENISYTTGDSPRVTALIRSETVETLRNIQLVATLFDSSGNAIGASSTIVPTLGPRATTQATFTWPMTLEGIVTRVEILPVLETFRP